MKKEEEYTKKEKTEKESLLPKKLADLFMTENPRKEKDSRKEVEERAKEEGKEKEYGDSRMKETILVFEERERKGSPETIDLERKVLQQKYFSSPSLKNVKISGKIRGFEGQIEAKSAQNKEIMHDLLVEGSQVECNLGCDRTSVSANKRHR